MSESTTADNLAAAIEAARADAVALVPGVERVVASYRRALDALDAAGAPPEDIDPASRALHTLIETLYDADAL